MSAASAKSIGFFTIGAIALVIVGILIFGSGNLFDEKTHVEMMFEGNVKGLKKGSSITFRGVRVGEVTAIEILPILDNSAVGILVNGVIQRGEADNRFADSWPDSDKLIDFLLAQGLKAQLVPESIVTGRLQIQLEFQPDKPGYALPGKKHNVVIPTIPTEFEVISDTVSQLAEEISNLPLKQIAQDVELITGGLEQLVSSAEMQHTLNDMAESAGHLRSILAEVDASKTTMKSDLAATTLSVREMATAISGAANNSAPVIAEAQHSLTQLNQMLEQANSTLKTYEKMVEPGSELSVTLIQTMKSFERTSNQVGQLAETLQRNPESVLTGKRR